MALQETPPSGRSPPRISKPKGPVDPPVCPQCNRGMTVKQVTPVLFASELDDVTYGCEKCGTETKRTVKRT